MLRVASPMPNHECRSEVQWGELKGLGFRGLGFRGLGFRFRILGFGPGCGASYLQRRAAVLGLCG